MTHHTPDKARSDASPAQQHAAARHTLEQVLLTGPSVLDQIPCPASLRRPFSSGRPERLSAALLLCLPISFQQEKAREGHTPHELETDFQPF